MINTTLLFWTDAGSGTVGVNVIESPLGVIQNAKRMADFRLNIREDEVVSKIYIILDE
jgi:hypothetical protein